MAVSITGICNQALAKIGSERINDIDDSSVGARQCREHYEQTRDALIRSHWWRFAAARATLSESADAPDFEWNTQFDLPNDFLRFKSFYSGNNTRLQTYTRGFAIEGNKLLTDEDTCEIRYIKKVTNPAEFDPLFIEVLVIQLAIKLVMSLAGDRLLRRELIEEMRLVLPAVRTMDRQETNTIGRALSWNEARLIGTGLGYRADIY